MGIHVVLGIRPYRITPGAWAAVFKDSVALLDGWRPTLLGWAIRSVEGKRVPMYTHSVAQEDDDPKKTHWSVVGDRETLRTAECQTLYRDLACYRTGRARKDEEDILVATARAGWEMEGRSAQVFGNETQGYPFHFAVLAAAMLVEERFPGRALAWGDFDRGQAEEARRLAAPILGRELALPVCVDPERLARRLRPHFQPSQLPEAFERVLAGEPGAQAEAMLQAFPGKQGARAWQRNLKRYSSANRGGAQRLVIAWLNTGRDLAEACRLACLNPAGPRFEPKAFVGCLASTWVGVPPAARAALDALQRPTDEAHGAWSQLGSVLLDQEAAGRHLRAYLEPSVVHRALVSAFKGQGEALHDELVEQSTTIEANLRKLAGPMKESVRRASEQVADDTSALVELKPEDAIGPHQRRAVRLVAWSVREMVQKLRARSQLASGFARPGTARRMLIEALAGDRVPTLTEGAWQFLLEEKDLDALVWCIGLVALDFSELRLWETRRALLERPRLRRLAMEIGRSEGEMREVGSLVRGRKRMNTATDL